VARGVDALALCGAGQSSTLLHFLQQRGTPTVHVMSLPPIGSVAAMDSAARRVYVGFDNAAAIGTAVRYLLDLGHRHIAMLAGLTHDNDRARARVQGVREALARAGLVLPPPRLVERAYALDAARDGLRVLMAPPAGLPPPTAVVCGNDVLAAGALLQAQRDRIAVPKRLSIVGFDDLDLAQHLIPGITTVRVPTAQMWRLAGERLLALLAGHSPEPVPLFSEIEVNLVVRGSSGVSAG
jgi:LacI family transcriptional regulator